MVVDNSASSTAICRRGALTWINALHAAPEQAILRKMAEDFLLDPPRSQIRRYGRSDALVEEPIPEGEQLLILASEIVSAHGGAVEQKTAEPLMPALPTWQAMERSLPILPQ